MPILDEAFADTTRAAGGNPGGSSSFTEHVMPGIDARRCIKYSAIRTQRVTVRLSTRLSVCFVGVEESSTVKVRL